MICGRRKVNFQPTNLFVVSRMSTKWFVAGERWIFNPQTCLWSVECPQNDLWPAKGEFSTHKQFCEQRKGCLLMTNWFAIIYGEKIAVLVLNVWNPSRTLADFKVVTRKDRNKQDNEDRFWKFSLWSSGVTKVDRWSWLNYGERF